MELDPNTLQPTGLIKELIAPTGHPLGFGQAYTTSSIYGKTHDWLTLAYNGHHGGSEIVQVGDSHGHWHTIPGSFRGRDCANGHATDVAGVYDDNGYTYMMGGNNDRSRDTAMLRAPNDSIGDRSNGNT